MADYTKNKMNYKPYDGPSVGGSQPTTRKPAHKPGRGGPFGRKPGGLATALERKGKMKALMKEMDK